MLRIAAALTGDPMRRTNQSSRGYAIVGLKDSKHAVNVGSVLRAAQVFGAIAVITQGKRYRRKPTDTMASYRRIPLLQVSDLHASIPFDCIPVAVELIEGALPLTTYHHPSRAFYIFGPEDGTLGKSVLSWCRDVVKIPTAYCLNLAACVNVVLYDRMSKVNGSF